MLLSFVFGKCSRWKVLIETHVNVMVTCTPKTVFIIFVHAFLSPHLLYSCATLQLAKYVLAEPDRFVGACVTTRVTPRSCVTSNTCASFNFLATPGTSTATAQICVHQNPSSSWLMLPFFFSPRSSSLCTYPFMWLWKTTWKVYLFSQQYGSAI